MVENRPVRWGILSTARITETSFLPGLREAGGGVSYAVAGRDRARTEAFAAENAIEHALEGYGTLLADEAVDAVYIPLPNSLHAEWTIAALRAGKAVLCEKPMCTSLEETRAVLNVARETGCLLWEAFVFPFHPQMNRLRQIIDSGAIGDVVEVETNFHFHLSTRNNIRLSADLAGGALNDVGCYCIHFGQFVLRSTPDAAVAMATWAPEGVDENMQAVLNFPPERRLWFSCGMSWGGATPRHDDTFSRVLGTAGQIRLTHPYHPGAHDTLEVRTARGVQVEQAAEDIPSFAAALRHINAAVRGEEQPRHLAIEDALPTAIGMQLARDAAREGRREEA